MSKLSKLGDNWQDRGFWVRTVLPWIGNRIPEPLLLAYSSVYWFCKRPDYIDVPEEDWDNLLLLDACRYDEFQMEEFEHGTCERRFSRGPRTEEFLKRNFGDDQYHDTVYVTANPHPETALDDGTFHDVYHVWRTHWDDELRSVHPEDVVTVARQAAEQYPNKRLVVHFIQPHAPYIGEWARQNIGIYSGISHTRSQAGEGNSTWETDPFNEVVKGNLDIEDVRRAYRENLRIALEHTDELLDDLTGKTVVSSDHGELFGEIGWPYPWPEAGHPKLQTKKSLEVPWCVIESETRKTVVAEPPGYSETGEEEDVIEDRLRHLGYQ